MTIQLRGLKEEVQRVLEEIMKAVDFDMEVLLESEPREIEAVVSNAVLSVIDQDEVPFIDWVRMVEEEEANELKNEKGEFTPN